MSLFRSRNFVFGVVLFAITGCQNPPPAKPKAAPSTATTPKSNETASAASAPVTKSQTETKPETFGFSVQNILIETCCSDTPGKPTPTGQISVEGLTPDNVRFALSCIDYVDLPRPSWTISKAARDHWFEMHTASIKHETYGDRMDIYNFSGKAPDYWKEFANCSIDGRLDDAKNESFVVVSSSSARDWKNGSGYEVKVNDRTEMMTLRCIQNGQSPCVSIPPATYRAIRDGSEVRLCDQDLTVLSTYQITDERFIR